MFSSTSKMNRHTASKSNFSLVEDVAQFRSTQVLELFIPFNSLIRNDYKIKHLYFQYPNSSIRGVLLIDSSSVLQPTSTPLPPIDDNEGT